ncbi:kinase-like protein [Hypoxylon trugodes]|uniref:kinase-like protein n=1 Tax=Hypoxylon trugodes TaxID=326681 RepID=UPI0021A18FA3|nr:kinase-like protein [Hypoxylon trugodes]KAI1390623.1 kinase-like protein [Hypoxylon trugodes]
MTSPVTTMESSPVPRIPPQSDEMIEYESMEMVIPHVEDVQKYNKGGFHPVHLDDVLNGRFEVVHKLGQGGFGTVWLCRDLNLKKWRAVKIIAADHSSKGTEEEIFNHLRSTSYDGEIEENHIVTPLEQFWIEGPNGRHSCLVLPVLGLDVEGWRLYQCDYEDETGLRVKNICRQIVEALNFLHNNGICHGDFRLQNILLEIEGIDDLDREQIYELMGVPELIEMTTVSGEPLTFRAPEYIVSPAIHGWSKKLVTDSVAIIDFGESFFSHNPPESTGIPSVYAAPEILFLGTGVPGFPSDVWSLACTLFELRRSAPLFSSFSDASIRGTICEMQQYLGPLPEKYRDVYSHMLRSVPRVKLDENGEYQRVPPEPPKPLTEEERQKIKESGEEEAERQRQFIAKTGYSDMFEAILGNEKTRYRKIDAPKREQIKYKYPREDVLGLSDLLRGMLKYEPADRITMAHVLQHSWFDEAYVQAAPTDPESRASLRCPPTLITLAYVVVMTVWAIAYAVGKRTEVLLTKMADVVLRPAPR